MAKKIDMNGVQYVLDGAVSAMDLVLSGLEDELYSVDQLDPDELGIGAKTLCDRVSKSYQPALDFIFASLRQLQDNVHAATT